MFLDFLSVAAALAVFGITIRKDTASLATKFVTRASAAATDYKDGVAASAGEWEARTAESEASYEAGVQESIAQKRFGRGVRGSGDKYRKNATELGSARYSGGIANAKDAWSRGVGPALDILKGLALPPRGPRRSPQNQARAAAVATALGAMKTGK